MIHFLRSLIFALKLLVIQHSMNIAVSLLYGVIAKMEWLLFVCEFEGLLHHKVHGLSIRSSCQLQTPRSQLRR